VERARLYDNYVDAQTRRENEKRILDFRRRAASQAQGKAQTLMLVDIGISAILAKIQAGGGDIAAAVQDPELRDLLTLATRGALALPQVLKAEALALGDSTDRPEVSLGVTAEDVLTKRIREDGDLRSLAAALVEQAGKPSE